jgi:hypothetical protein
MKYDNRRIDRPPHTRSLLAFSEKNEKPIQEFLPCELTFNPKQDTMDRFYVGVFPIN